MDTSAVDMINSICVSPAKPEPMTLPNMRCVGLAQVISISIARVFFSATTFCDTI